MTYSEWEADVSGTIKGDSLWRMEAYRLALFLADLSWTDVTNLMKDNRTLRVADQLYRSAGSIGANLAEGYSRGTGKDRARFYEYALGSARECRHWYYQSRAVLTSSVVEHRLGLLTQITKILLVMVPQQRQKAIREERIDYTTDANWQFETVPLSPNDRDEAKNI